MERRIVELRCGIERMIEKACYDEYGSFEDVRNRIIALGEEILREDSNQIEICTRIAPHVCRVNGPCNGWPKD